MHITQLDIEGFRSLADVTWKPGVLNVVIGPNGSGKSNLLRLLEMISAGAQGKLSDYVQSAGGMEAILWDGRSSQIKFIIETSPAEYFVALPKGEKIVQLPHLSYAVILTRVGYGTAYQVADETLGSVDKDVYYIEREGRQAVVGDGNVSADLTGDTIVEQELVVVMADNPFSTNQEVPIFRKYLSVWSIYHAINTSADAVIRQPVVTRLETQVAPNGQNLINVLHTLYTSDRDFKASINSAMRAAFGPDYDELIFPPASDQRIQLRLRWKTLKREQSAADLSDGTLRFLFLMAVLANPHPAPLIAIDEPETGLHPSMLPIIAEYAVEASRRTQVIFTTHSDQFLDAFGDTKPTTTVAKWEDGKTTLTTLAEDELVYWLADYTLGKLFRTGEMEALA